MIKVATFGIKVIVSGLVFFSISFLEAEPEPIENFFRATLFSNASLSPDGEHVGYIGYINDSYELFTLNLNTKKIIGIRTGMGLHIRQFYWADNDNLIFNVTKWGQYYYGLYSVNRIGKPIRTLVDIENYASVIDLQDDLPNKILIQFFSERFHKPHVHQMNYLRDARQHGPMAPGSGYYPIKEENPGYVDAWMCDPEGFLRMGVGYKKRSFNEGNETYIYRKNEDLPWDKLPLPPDLDPVAFEYGGKTLYVATNRNHNVLSLYNYDLENQQLGELIFSDREYDVTSGKFFIYQIPASLFFSKKKKALVGIHYTREKRTTHWIDPFYRQLQLGIDQALPDTVN